MELFLNFYNSREAVSEFLTVFENNYTPNANDFVKSNLTNGILKRVIMNGMSGSSWIFKRFDILCATVNSDELSIGIWNISDVMESIEKYAGVGGSEDKMKHDDDAGGDEVNQLDLDFVDDETNFQDQKSTDYRLCYQRFARCHRVQVNDIRPRFNSLWSRKFFSDFVDKVSYEVFGFEKWIQMFELKVFEKESKDSFYFSKHYAICYHLFEKKEDFEFCQDEERLRDVLGLNFFENLKLKKHSLLLGLSLSTFET